MTASKSKKMENFCLGESILLNSQPKRVMINKYVTTSRPAKNIDINASA